MLRYTVEVLSLWAHISPARFKQRLHSKAKKSIVWLVVGWLLVVEVDAVDGEYTITYVKRTSGYSDR